MQTDQAWVTTVFIDRYFKWNHLPDGHANLSSHSSRGSLKNLCSRPDYLAAGTTQAGRTKNSPHKPGRTEQPFQTWEPQQPAPSTVAVNKSINLINLERIKRLGSSPVNDYSLSKGGRINQRI